MRFYSSAETDNDEKKMLLRLGEPEYSHVQSRMSFTLAEPEDLFQPRCLLPGTRKSAQTAIGGTESTHAELFGSYAIGIDPQNARRLGITPTLYFSNDDYFGDRFSARDGSQRPGLSLFLFRSLKEVRDVLIVLALVEAGIDVDGVKLPTREEIEELNYRLPYERQIEESMERLSGADREFIFQVFNIDRELAFNLLGAVDMLMALFQEADSTSGADTLEYYQQREWRLVHHMRPGTAWYCLGDQPSFRDSLGNERKSEQAEIRSLIDPNRMREHSYFQHCWILEGVDGQRFSDYINCIIVPEDEVSTAKSICKKHNVKCEVISSSVFV